MLKGLGVYPDVSLADARKKAKEIRSSMAAGVDPKAKPESSNLFKTISGEWFEHWKADKAPRHVEQTQKRLAEINEAFGSKSIDDVSAADIRELMLAIMKRGALDIAKRSHQTCGQIFEYAITHGKAKRNPSKDFKPGIIIGTRKDENHPM